MFGIWWGVHIVKCQQLLDEGSTVTAGAFFEQLRNLKANVENFQTCDDIKKALEHFFEGQFSAFWSMGIYDPPKSWQKTIDANGAYFK
ncbi:hypothetical protein ANCDUO_00584 [Ancylostoma duodenale]|uniref:Uncharacterized protein n=1 Tax=Ancylostoma duodenale TaxID=51022 RepID=A0A0C2HBN9_9BILA|nr:hypothetical protein ANCDUO_00584 [Ancylostoma duodenale]